MADTWLTPSWTDASRTGDILEVIAATTVALGESARGTLDLRTKERARLFISIGRGGTTALTTSGVKVRISALPGNDEDGLRATDGTPRVGNTAAAASTTVNSDSAADQKVLNVASSAGFAAGDVVCVQDSGGGVTRLEFGKVSKVAAGAITLDAPLQFGHTAVQADTVRNQANQWTIGLDGGSLYEIVIDYGASGAGDTVTIEVLAQTLDKIVASPQ